MSTLNVLEILLFEVGSVLAPTQRSTLEKGLITFSGSATQLY